MHGHVQDEISICSLLMTCATACQVLPGVLCWDLCQTLLVRSHLDGLPEAILSLCSSCRSAACSVVLAQQLLLLPHASCVLLQPNICPPPSCCPWHIHRLMGPAG